MLPGQKNKAALQLACEEVIMLTWLEKIERNAERRAERRARTLGEKRGMIIGISKLWAARIGPMPPDLAQRLLAVTRLAKLNQILEALLRVHDQDEAIK